MANPSGNGAWVSAVPNNNSGSPHTENQNPQKGKVWAGSATQSTGSERSLDGARWRVTLYGHGNFALSPGPTLPQGLFQNRRMMYFVGCKEVAVKDSIRRPNGRV